jgi:hypothetical protein
MACSLCGVPGFGRSCSAHTGTDSQTYDEQRSKQQGIKIQFFLFMGLE